MALTNPNYTFITRTINYTFITRTIYYMSITCQMGWYFAPLSGQSISPYIFIYQPLTAPSTLYCYIGRYKQKVFINYNIFHVVVATSVT